MSVSKKSTLIFNMILVVALLLLPEWVSSLQTPIRIVSSLQLFVDDYIIKELQGGAYLKLHNPVAQEIVFTTPDFPWEGSSTAHGTVFQDGDIYRMYYRTNTLSMMFNVYPHMHSGPSLYANAESKGGAEWIKPFLSLVEFDGTEETNIFWMGHQFAPFKDTYPDAPPEALYKAMAGFPMYAYQSPME